MYIIILNLPSIVTVSILGGGGVADTAPEEVGDIGSVGAGHTKIFAAVTMHNYQLYYMPDIVEVHCCVISE